MDDLRKAQCAQPRDGQTGRPPGGRLGVRWFARWNSVWLLAAAGAILLWCISRWLPSSQGKPDTENGRGHSPPAAGTPEPSPEVILNNETAELKLPPALEGTAIIYPEEVVGLVATDGRFRTDLSVSAMAQLLKLDKKVIAKKGSDAEIDPDIVLFAAVAGRLTDQAKARSRWVREQQALRGQPPSAAGDEWVKTVFPFTLHSIQSPTDEQKTILDAISRSARGMPRQPGTKANAIKLPYSRAELLAGEVEFAGGFLPLESSPTATQAKNR